MVDALGYEGLQGLLIGSVANWILGHEPPF
jgi:hypothetical protein